MDKLLKYVYQESMCKLWFGTPFEFSFLNFYSLSVFHGQLLISLIFFLLFLLAVLLSIAFFTVFERKILAAVQGRKGPNFVGFVGILQAIADGLKLFLKETTIPNRSSKFLFIFSPILM